MEILMLIAIGSAVSALGSFLKRSPYGDDEQRRRMAAMASRQWQDVSRRNQQHRQQHWRR
jgi:hypothetical protein